MLLHRPLCAAMAVSLAITSMTTAQTIVKKEVTAGGNILLLQELAAIISGEDGILKVENLLPPSARPEECRDIDIKEGDEILMINASRVRTVEEVKKLHENLEIGEPMKMGIRRGEEMFIIEFKKIDPGKLPKREMMVMRAYEPGAPAAAGEASPQLLIENTDGSLRVLPGTGVLFKVEDEGITISHVLPIAEKMLGGTPLKEGDVLKTLNGVKIESFAQLESRYNDLETGADVTFALQRGDEEITVTFKKPRAEGKILMKGK